MYIYILMLDYMVYCDYNIFSFTGVQLTCNKLYILKVYNLLRFDICR